jgi:SAM-dependent methyltransferase
MRIRVTRETGEFTIPAADFASFEFEDGDRLTVLPRWAARGLPTSPDGARHISLGYGRSAHVPARMKYLEYRGFRIPAHLVTLTGAGPESFEAIGMAHMAHYRRHIGLTPGMSVLEIGSGIGRDALQLADILGTAGRYCGVDVTPASIEWCRRNISARHPNFTFHHFDARHELYNPLGAHGTADFTLPLTDASVDRVFLGSVFTHLFEHELLHYMQEIARVLRRDGLAYATFFLYSPETIAAARRTDRTPFKLRFEHSYGEGCYINDPANPTGAVAYTDDSMRRIIDASGLVLDRPFLKGWWSGAHEEADDGQEVAIVRKPA